MKILHLSFHLGCAAELQYVADKLGHELITRIFDDGTAGKYNVGHDRAAKYYSSNVEYFKTFDVIVTSDTAPISRVFLQHDWPGKLVIWINNRFDYADQANNDCAFPDKEFYDLMKKAATQENVTICGYTPFENIYCRRKGIEIGDLCIKPTGGSGAAISVNCSRKDLVFVGSYHNDNIMMKLADKLRIDLGLSVYNGRYAGISDLATYKCVVHIPYAWSNYALFENVRAGIVTFIPSKRFFLELKKEKDFFWSPPYRDEDLEISEWYNPENFEFFEFFDSWQELVEKISTCCTNDARQKLRELGLKHEQQQMTKWAEILPPSVPLIAPTDVNKMQMQVIIWGHQLHDHTHSYIHKGFFDGFTALGYETHWLTESSDFVFNKNCLIISHGIVTTHLPIVDGAKYVLHNAELRTIEGNGDLIPKNYFDESVTKGIPRKNLLTMQVYTNDCIGRDKKDEEHPFHYYNDGIIYFPWATDLLPDEVQANIDQLDTIMTMEKNEVNFIGMPTTPWNTMKEFCDLNRFKYSQYGGTFDRTSSSNKSKEENMQLIQQSILAPALQTDWQVEHGYIPCRIFKNISYGKLGITNNPHVHELFNHETIYSSDLNELFATSLISRKDKSKIIRLMEEVRDKHTYINRCQYILDHVCS